MSSITEQVSQLLSKHAAKHFVVAFSGGVDSHVLLHAMKQGIQIHQQHKISAIHVNHQLNPLSDHWQRHCVAVAEQLAIAITCVQVEVPKNSLAGLEASAREARYTAIKAQTSEHCMVVLGQHRDDQLETFLLRLKRGSGPNGLSAMQADSMSFQRHMCRPLLTVSRAQIVEYANAHNLQWIEDDSNCEQRFERNFLRHGVIPQLTARWPSFAANVARSASLCAEQQGLVDEITQEYAGQCIDSEQRLILAEFERFSAQWKRQLLRYWLSAFLAKPPSLAQLDMLQRSVVESKQDGQASLQLKGIMVRRYQGMLYCLEEKQQYSDLLLGWQSQGKLDWGPYWQIECYDKPMSCCDIPVPIALLKTQVIEFRNYPYSTSFRPYNEQHHKPLKQWFKHWNVSPWQRSQTPQLWVAGQLVGVLGRGAAYAWLEQQTDQQCRYFHLVPRIP